MTSSDSDRLTTEALRVSYTPYADLLVARLPGREPPLLVRVDDRIVLYVRRDDPVQVVGFDIEDVLDDYEEVDLDRLRELLGEGVVEHLVLWLNESVRPFRDQRRPLADLSDSEVDAALAERPEPLSLSLPPMTSEIEEARLNQIEAYLQEVLHQTPALIQLSSTILPALGERARATLESAKHAVWGLQRRPLAAAGAQTGQVEPGVVADHFEDVALGFEVKVDVEGDFLIAYGSLPVETAVTLNLELALTEIGVSLLEDPPGTPSLLGSGMTRESGQFRIPLGRVTGPPPPHEPLVDMLQIEVAEQTPDGGK